jgi:cell division protein FtsL
MEKILNGKNAEWTKLRMEKTPNGTKRRMENIEINNLDIVEWKKRRTGQKVEWKTYIED